MELTAKILIADENADSGLLMDSDEAQMAIAEQLYAELQKRGVEVMLDDRNERPGVKFKDADLIGYPVRITVGKKSAEEGTVEYKLRTEAENEVVALDEVVEKTVAYIFS